MPEGFIFREWCSKCNEYCEHIAVKMRDGRIHGVCNNPIKTHN